MTKAASLSPETLATRRYQSRMLLSLCPPGKDLSWALRHPKEIQEAMVGRGYSRATQASLCSLVRVLLRDSPGVPSLSRKTWIRHHETLSREIQDLRETNEAPPSYLELYVPWRDICKARDRLPRGCPQRTLLSLLTMIPPCRRNLGRLHWGDIPGENCIDWPRREIVYRRYKTSKSYGDIRVPLPEDLQRVLEDHRRWYPEQDWVLGDRGNRPYRDGQSFGRWVQETCQEVLGKPLGVNVFRHCYLSEGVSLDRLSVRERKEIARAMGHSIEMQMMYRYL